MPRVVAVAAASIQFAMPLTASAAEPVWEQWQAVPGVFDLGGPRADGSLLVAGSAALYTLTPGGTLSPFARGVGGYRDDPGAEAYLAVSPGLAGQGCSFGRDDTYILRLHAPAGVTRVSAAGDQTGPFTNLRLPTLTGIAFDTSDSFGHRLLVSGQANGKSELDAVDCAGSVQVVTNSAPIFEGGIAVAPPSFGAYGGSLIAPDELSGVIWAISADGTSRQVAAAGLPKGPDIGVEGVAFVPAGFSRGGYLYYADRATPGNPHPGSDHVLRLSSDELVAAGVRDGDLLAATEGGASMIDVRCAATCQVTTIAGQATAAHGEGHLAFTLTAGSSPTPSPSPSASPSAAAGTAAGSCGATIAWLVAVGAALLAAGAVLLARRR